MFHSVRPRRRQPTRLPRPWDSPGKNTGVGCHFLLQCMKVKSESEVAQSCPTLSNAMDRSLPGSSVHGIFQARVLEWVAIAFSLKRCSAAAAAKSLQSCPTLCNPTDSSPTRLPCPWDSQGKNTGVGHHCLLQRRCSVQFNSVVQSYLTLCDPMDCSTPGFLVHHQHPELTQTHIHRVGDAIQPSHPLSSPSPPAFNLSQHQGLFH